MQSIMQACRADDRGHDSSGLLETIVLTTRRSSWIACARAMAHLRPVRYSLRLMTV